MNTLRKDALRRMVHAICGKKGLGLSDDERRAIQKSVTGQDSISAMSLPQLEDLVAHLRKLQSAVKNESGANGNDEWRFVFRLAPDRQPYAKKIYHIAKRLGALQENPVPIMSKAYIEGIASRMAGAETRLEFCDADRLHKIVQSLEMYVKRHGG